MPSTIPFWGAVALGATQLNELHQKTQIEKTKLCVYLKNLAEVGLVRREFSMSEKPKEQGNVQRGLYAIENNFFRFWYVSYVFFSRSGFTKGASQRIEELGGMAISEAQLLF